MIDHDADGDGHRAAAVRQRRRGTISVAIDRDDDARPPSDANDATRTGGTRFRSRQARLSYMALRDSPTCIDEALGQRVFDSHVGICRVVQSYGGGGGRAEDHCCLVVLAAEMGRLTPPGGGGAPITSVGDFHVGIQYLYREGRP